MSYLYFQNILKTVLLKSFVIGYIQVCRGLMISAVCLGFFATACALLGMKCTKIGGSAQLKARIACFSGLQYCISGA